MKQDSSISEEFVVPEDVLTIGEMARTYSVTLRALRFYEDRGLIQPIRSGTSRFYDAATRKRLELILKGKQLGFTLSEIRDLLSSQAEEQVPSLELTLDATQILAQIDMLQRQRDGIERAIEELRQTHQRLNGGEAVPVTVLATETGVRAS